MRNAIGKTSGQRRLTESLWQHLFRSASGEAAALILAYSDITRGRFFANNINTRTFDDLHTFSRASTATNTDRTSTLETVTSGAHRLDHDKDGNRLGLLIGEVRTNVCSQSEKVFGAPWLDINSIEVFSNTIVAPDGTTTADRINDVEFGAFAAIAQDITIAATNLPYTYSAFVKKATQTTFPEFQIDMTGGTRVRGAVQLDTETGATVIRLDEGGGTASVAVEELKDYWRISLTVINVGGNTTLRTLIFPGVTTTFGAIEASALGGINVWGHQVEQGSFATSYIPTTTVAVTRAAETSPVATSGWDFSATAGSLYGVVTSNHTPTAELILLSLNDDTANEKIEVYADASANVKFRVTDGGVDQCDIDSGVDAVGGTELKIAVAWAANDFVISVNGATVVTDTGGTLPTVTQLEPCENGHTTSLAEFNLRLIDGDLEAMTA